MNKILRTILMLDNVVDVSNIPTNIQSTYDNLDYYKFEDFVNLLIDTQHKLNVKLCGEEFTSNLLTRKGKKIRFGNALLSEANELLDSTPWKHWKSVDEKINKENISVELVDFLHFLPSIISTLENKSNVDFSRNDLIKIAWRELNKNTIINPDNETIEKEVNKLVSIASIVSGMSNLTELLNPDIEFDVSDTTHNMYLIDVLIKLIGLTLGLTYKLHFMIFNSNMESIWSLYVIKNTLNGFRKDHGYAEGTYNKMWNGKEDNIVAMEVMEKNPNYGVQELYNTLDSEYNKLGK